MARRKITKDRELIMLREFCYTLLLQTDKIPEGQTDVKAPFKSSYFALMASVGRIDDLADSIEKFNVEVIKKESEREAQNNQAS